MNNISVIVFSKDRPMQLHAYLESLLHFSDITEENISVLWKKTDGIDYSKVINSFQRTKWIQENNFHHDLMQTIQDANDYILFGCDDVVFNNSFITQNTIKILENDNNIFAFSLRLGSNIIPLPDKIISQSNFLKWNWKETQAPHYNYPWELDCTIYRKSDILSMLNNYADTIKSPNYLESIFAEEPAKYISKLDLACFNGKNHAIVITVNRVQDTHCNPIDDTEDTDIQTLNTIYNHDNNKLDILTISELENHYIHVGSEYFILLNRELNWTKPIIKLPKKRSFLRKNLKQISKSFKKWIFRNK